MYFKLYKDGLGEWRWTLFAANNQKIADSSEGYKSRADCCDGIDRVRVSNASTPIVE